MAGGRRARVLFDDEVAGLLEETPDGVRFTYDARWLEREDAQPVSLTLPLCAKAYASRTPHPFFLGLLPEGWLLAISLSALKLSPDDVFGLLLHLCRDCVGAVRVVPAEEDEVKG